ncbi:MAG TPA: NUDIX hydrolase [Candidatus Limosilactobacillus faecipullorum]|nr:NUDIX hydrolase [Candidatus Limosilactobacillus faecipullorum]
MNFEEKVLRSEKIFEGYLIQVEKQTVKTPMGNEASREIVHHAPAVAILMVNDDNQIALMKQWRAAIQKVTYEIPAGKVDQRDQGNVERAAIREMNEETRLKAGHLEKIDGAYTSIGFCDEYITTFLATELSPVEEALPQDADEELAMFWVDQAKALSMIKDGQIEDQKTISAIYYWAATTK